MWSKLPIIGWALSLLFTISSAIPFYYLWNYTAPKYFYQVPEVYQTLPFWDIVWLFMTISILKYILVGGIFKSNTTNNIKK